MDANEAAAWQSAINSVNGAVTTIASSNLNYKTREWNEKIMNQQRDWALSDWQRNADYNSPQMQMERLKAAGLNPNLVYGKGADATAAPVRASPSATWSPQAIDMRGQGNTLEQFYDLRMKDAQLKNMDAANAVAKQDALLRAAQVVSQLTGNKSSEFDLWLKEQIKQQSVQAAQISNDKMLAEISILQNRDIRETIMQGKNIEEIIEKIKLLKLQEAKTEEEKKAIIQSVENAKKDGMLKDFEIMLNKNGIDKNSPWYIKMLGYMATDIFGNNISKP